MRTVKKLNVVSLARIMAVLYGGIYLIVGLIVNLGVLLFGIPALESFDFLGFGSGILATLLMAILVGAISFVFGVVIGWLYNLAAKIVGGVTWEETIRGKERLPVKPVAPQDEVNQILDQTKKTEEPDTFRPEADLAGSSDNPNFLSS